MRIGYDHYEREVRVCGMRENQNQWSTGRWVRTDCCHLLESGDKLQATADIEDSSEMRRTIRARSVCRFIGQDGDGDIIVNTGNQLLTIFAEDLEKLSLL